ncbi:MAG: sensor histidine kinase [Bdellovibrionales bacterium]
MDVCFGAYFIGLALLSGVAAYNQQTSWWGFISQLSFPITNLIISQVSFRLKNPTPFEIFRLSLNCIFFAPLAFLLTDGALDQYWITAAMLTLGSSIIVMSITSNPTHGKIIVCAYVTMMVLVATFSPKPVNWYLFGMYAGLALMLGSFITQTMEVLTKSLRRESEHTQELERSQKIIMDQQQALVSSSKMSALGEMAGGVAHEINNPLAVIKTLSAQLLEVIEEQNIDRPLAKEMATQIESTTDRIAKIVRSMRSFSRDGSNDPYQSVNIHQLIEETLSFCRERFIGHGTPVTVESFNKNLCIEGRYTELSQVLLNLFNNAHDAILHHTDKWIKVSVSDQQDWVELHITDSGTGISPEVQNKMFQPFFTTKEIGAGTGMGLSISTGIIDSHSGELRLNNKCKNTSFVIRLPKFQKPARSKSAA